ncbi:MAG: type II toxin-antitoxin system VapC family toxin [Methanomicrobiales archaeon]
MNFFLDTSICVDVLRTNGPQKSFELFESFADNKNTGIISVITIAELSAGAALSPRNDAIKKTQELLAYVRFVELDESIALAGGKIYAKLSQAGRKIEFNDCLIAATAQSLGMSEIVTRNCDHFNRIDGCSAIVPENLNF